MEFLLAAGKWQSCGNIQLDALYYDKIVTAATK
jgi:hypothetical protein